MWFKDKTNKKSFIEIEKPYTVFFTKLMLHTTARFQKYYFYGFTFFVTLVLYFDK